MSEEVRIPEPGDVVGGRYRVEAEIGRGGFGVVFKARNLVGAPPEVALKMLLPKALTREGMLERFDREARLASSLTSRNSVMLHDYGVHQPDPYADALPYIAMEYLRGKMLSSHLHLRKQLSQGETAEILVQVLDSLAEAHDRGIVHRDIKPENVFICDGLDNRGMRLIKVLDFGVAKAVSGNWGQETMRSLTQEGVIPGTAEYMSPEQAMGAEDLTPATDIYAVGIMAFYMLTGVLPIKGKNPMDTAMRQVVDPVPELPPQHHNTPLAAAIHKALAKEPGDRFPHARAFMEAIRAMVPEGPAQPQADPTMLDAPALQTRPAWLDDPDAEPSSPSSSARPARRHRNPDSVDAPTPRRHQAPSGHAQAPSPKAPPQEVPVAPATATDDNMKLIWMTIAAVALLFVLISGGAILVSIIIIAM